MCRQPFSLDTPKGKFSVPCGKCYPCKANRKQQWQFRLHQEQKHANSSAFITLTYNDENLPLKNGISHLFKKDLQLFIKTLRDNHVTYNMQKYGYKTKKETRKNTKGLRYFACGEYGETTNRPHYHLLLFNLDYCNHIALSKSWTKGSIHIGDVNNETIAYTAKYIMKPQNEIHKEHPQFNTMSLKPFIGHQYMANKKYHVENKEILCKDWNGNLMMLPKIYRKKMFRLDYNLLGNEKTIHPLETALLKKHFIEYEQNIQKEHKRLEKLGNSIAMIEISHIQDEIRKQKQINKAETL